MEDARIERTRKYVLDAVRTMLEERSGEPITFSSLSRTARVSRRTLYMYWGTVEKLIADAVTADRSDFDFSASMDSSPRERLRLFLKTFRSGISGPLTSVALATMISQATTDDRSAESLAGMVDKPMSHLETLMGPISRDDYARLVGPIFVTEFIYRTHASDDLIEALVEQGLEIFGVDTRSADLRPAIPAQPAS
jgi:AcrR family transcriptional regulator